MPAISPYTPGLVLGNFKTTDYNTDLEQALLVKKQQQYDVFLSRLHNMQSSALNVSMLNLKGQEKLEQYNKEIDDMLSGDIGDLTNEKVQSRLASVFTKISADTDLKKRSQLSSHYQQQMSMIEGMRNSKDPTKSGYNSINEAVFKGWEGGLNDFMLADDITGWDQKKQSYTPYKDIDQKLVNLTKLLHAESQTVQKPVLQKQKIEVKNADGSVSTKEVEVPTGYDILTASKGVSQSRIRQLLETTLDQDERSQLEILSKYRILQSQSPEGKANLFNSYSRWLSTENKNTKQQLTQVQALKSQYEKTIQGINLPPEEAIIQKAALQNEIDRLTELEDGLNIALVKQTTNQMSQDDWMRLSNNEILPFINQLTNESYVNGISEALSWKDEVSKVGVDETYFAQLKINSMKDRLALDAELGRAGLAIRAAELELKRAKQESEITTPGVARDIIKDETELVSSWDRFMQMGKEINDVTTPIITSKTGDKYDIDPKNLQDNRWLQANANNHEVKLWNAYVGKFGKDVAFTNEKPNLAGFEAFKNGVKNGLFSNDQTLNNLQEAYDTDLVKQEWFKNKAGKVAQTINNQTKVSDVKIGNGPSLEDYARMNNWNGQGEMTFGVKDGKGGYKQMTWSEVKQEYKKGRDIAKSKNTKDIYGNKLGVPVIGDAINKITDTFPGLAKIEGLLSNDLHFARTVEKAIEQEQKSSQLIKNITAEQLPQFIQNTHYVFEDPKEVAKFEPYILESLKQISEDSNFGIPSNSIAAVLQPNYQGDGAFMIKPEHVKHFENLSLIDAQGNKVEEVKAGEWYRAKVPSATQRDHLLNLIFEDIGEVSKTINGTKVKVRDIKDSNFVYVDIDGQTRAVERKDINAIFREIENILKLQKQAESRPK